MGSANTGFIQRENLVKLIFLWLKNSKGCQFWTSNPSGVNSRFLNREHLSQKWNVQKWINERCAPSNTWHILEICIHRSHLSENVIIAKAWRDISWQVVVHEFWCQRNLNGRKQMDKCALITNTQNQSTILPFQILFEHSSRQPFQCLQLAQWKPAAKM